MLCPNVQTRQWQLQTPQQLASRGSGRRIMQPVRASGVTAGQRRRGHEEPGALGWQVAGCDIFKKTLSPDMRDMLVTYGEMVQAAYDKLGKNRCATSEYGKVILAPGQGPAHLLDYLQGNYRLAPDKEGPSPSTANEYELPQLVEKLQDCEVPLIDALPGHFFGNKPAPRPEPSGWLSIALAPFVNKMFSTVSGMLVAFVDGGNGGRPLFSTAPNGHGKQPRGAFFGYVATSKPGTNDNEVDVALVWRGTIFREEWESNFAQDELNVWQSTPDPGSPVTGFPPEPRKSYPKPGEVGVHDGFNDLYNRVVKTAEYGTKPSPREVLHTWLPTLLKEHNVTTITVTGHSLGGGLATLSAFDVAELLDRMWGVWDKKEWKTTAPPKVTLITFAAPRVGNSTFVDKFHDLGIAALRINNKGDMVPNVPGIWVQLLSGIIERVPVFGKAAAIDMTSPLVRFSRWIYSTTAWLTSRIFQSRWGYFHVGQVLELDPAWASGLDVEGLGKKHNLELYIHLLSMVGTDGVGTLPGKTERNPLLLNKSDSILEGGTEEEKKKIPADWWKEKDHRGCRQLSDGRWVYP